MIETTQEPAAGEERELPAGRRRVRLGDVCELNPRRPPLQRAADAPTTFVPMSAVEEHGHGIQHPEVRPFGEVKNGYTYFANGDVIFAKITPCMQNGKHAIAEGLIDGIGFGSTEFHVIHPKGPVTPEWIHSFIMQPHVLEAAKSHFAGAVGQQRVPGSYLEDLMIPLPPLAEQRRIAAILREQTAAMDRARAAAEAQLEAARALLAAYLRALFESEEAQEWPSVALGAILREDSLNGLAPRPSDDQYGTPILRISAGTSRDDWLVDESDYKYLWVDEATKSRYQLVSGDLLACRFNGNLRYVGKFSLYGGCAKLAQVYPDKLIRFRVALEKAVPEFVVAAMNAPQQRSQIEAVCDTTAGNIGISARELKDIELPLPPITEQQRIAAMLGEQMAGTQRVRRVMQEQVDAIEALPAALLRQAFSGEL